MAVEFDTSEVAALGKVLVEASAGTMADVGRVVARGALNIKTDAARRISGHPRFRRLPAAINFDLFTSLRGPAAEIGPDHRKPQGNLGHISEYGTPTSAPIPYMTPAAEAEEPRFVKALEDVAVKALGL